MSDIVKQTILLVDDDEGVLKALRRLLAELDVKVITATSGEEGLNVLKQQPVAVIISDQRMPHMTGVEFLQRSQEISPESIRVLLTGYADIDVTVDAINKGCVKYYFNKPWDDEFLLSRIKESLEMQAMQQENKRLMELTQQQNEQLKQLNASLEQRVAEQTAEIKARHEELKRSFMETIKAFSTIVELRFQEVGSHSQRVGALVRKILKSFDLSPQEYQDIVVAAFLHDIGKISIPDKVLAKKPEQYTSKDRELIARHPILGQSCVYHINGFEEVGVLIRNHHENFDGSGYPDGLVEMQIPLGARLIRIADSFDHHAFAKGYPNMDALNAASAHLVRHAGSKFDPKLVRKFIECDAAKEFFLKESSDVVILEPAELKEEMVIAADVYTQHGMFLVPKGAKLTKGMINRIRKIHEVDPVINGVQIFNQTRQKRGSEAYVEI